MYSAFSVTRYLISLTVCSVFVLIKNIHRSLFDFRMDISDSYFSDQNLVMFQN